MMAVERSKFSSLGHLSASMASFTGSAVGAFNAPAEEGEGEGEDASKWASASAPLLSPLFPFVPKAPPPSAPPASSPRPAEVSKVGATGGSARGSTELKSKEGTENWESDVDDDDDKQRDTPSGKVKLFCFLWTPRRPSDEAMMNEVKVEFAECDGHAFFTDIGTPGPPDPGMVKVAVPEQSAARDTPNWLYHRNFVGLLPTWAYICRSGLGEQFDWMINTEIDHWMSAARVRLNILAYLDVLRNGTDSDRTALEKPMMLAWGNAFLFNRRLVKVMCDLWPDVGKASTHPVARGCPAFMQGRTEWPEHCSQDMVYPVLADILRRHGVSSFGPSGCGQPDRSNGLGQKFPLTCWELSYDIREQMLLDYVRVIAQADNMTNVHEAEKYFKTHHPEMPWKVWWNGRGVPIIHHAKFSSGHRLAHELLHPIPPQTPLFPT